MTEAQRLKDLGNAAFAAKDFTEAVRLFGLAIDADPTNHVLWSNRSGAHASLGNYTSALSDAQKCVELNPTWAKGYSRLGLAQLELGQVVEAAGAYKKGAELDPNNAAIREGLARCQKAAGGMFSKDQMLLSIARALDDPLYRQYQEEDPTFLERVAGLMGKLMENPSQEALQMALLMNPDERVAGACAKLMGVEIPKQAQPPAAKPKKEEPPAPELSETEAAAEALKAEGNALYKARKFEEAIVKYDEAIAANPAQLLYVNNKAAVFIEMGRYEECESLLNEALEKRYEVKAPYESVAKIYSRLAALYRKTGDLDKAVEMYEKSLTEDNNRQTRAALKETTTLRDKQKRQAYINPELAEEHRERGNEHFKAKRFPDAKKEYDEAIRRDPQNAKLYSNRAAALTSLMELPSALKDVEKALEIEPTFVKAWSRKGLIHFRMKEYHKSMDAYQKGLNVDPNSEECRSGLERTMFQIQSQSTSTEVDEERYAQAMQDPEIQRILGDPQFQLILKELSSNPASVATYLQDPKIAEGINKLIAAGIVRIG